MIESCPVNPLRCLFPAPGAPLALLLLLAGPAGAQVSPDQAPPRIPPITQPPGATIRAEPVALFIAACDANGDAQIGRAELAACTARSFVSIANGAAALGYIQFSDWSLKWLGDRNALPSPFETDSDGDNRITLTELQAQLERTFARLDRTRDGVLTRDELLTLGAFERPAGRDGDDRRGRRNGGRGREDGRGQ